MKTAIIIPARYGSTRLPGKPLKLIAGQTMLSRVVEIARAAVTGRTDVDIYVATDDERIVAHCDEIKVASIMTSESCETGTERVREAFLGLDKPYDFILNLQGDVPVTPPHIITALIDAYAASEGTVDIVTPVVQLTWEELDVLRERKKTTPFSGTTVTLGPDGNALWFSKTIIPAIRKEDKHRAKGPLSPIYRHPGMYGYSPQVLRDYTTMQETDYEIYEGLEQLRYLYNGYKVRCVPCEYGVWAAMSGVDSPEDVTRCEALIAKHGELLGSASKVAQAV